MSARQRSSLSFRDALFSLESLPMDTVISVEQPRDMDVPRGVTAGEWVCRLVYGAATVDRVGALLVLAGKPVLRAPKDES